MALWKAGAETYALSLHQSGLDTLAVDAPGMHTVCQDITKWQETKAAVQKITEEGVIDLLVYNAGVGIEEKMGAITEENVGLTINTNLVAGINVAQEISKAMVAGGKGGSIVFVSSVFSILSYAGYTSYCASKAGLDAAARVMALELGPSQIRVNCVNPTIVMTAMGKEHWLAFPQKLAEVQARIPLRKVAEVRDVVNTTLYLLSGKSDMITGNSIMLDGGLSIC